MDGTLPPLLREEERLRVFQNEVLKERHNLFYSPNTS
jgi:hypothetical protein